VILVLLFSECGLPKDSLLDLALATDASLLTYDERGAFVEVLAFTEDARAEVRIHKLIETALDEASSYRSDEVVRFIEFTAHTLLYEVEREFPPEQYRRAVELGFTFSRRSTVVDRLAGAEREFFDFQGID
jgi:hypothetical protein